MAGTLADLATQSTDPFEKAYIKLAVEVSPILEYIPMVKINGGAHKHRYDDQLPVPQWRRVNDVILESTGTLKPTTEALYALGSEWFLDNFILRTQSTGGDSVDLWALQEEMHVRALGREYSRTFFYGDDLINPDEMQGVRRRLNGTQVLLAGNGGASLTLTMMDELIDAVYGNNRHLFMSKTHRRKFTSLARSAGSSITVSYSNINSIGEQITSYDGVPVHIIEDGPTGNTIFGFNEDPGDGTADTASIYCINFGEMDGFYGIYNGDGPTIGGRDLGEDQDAPGRKGRVEFFTGMVQAIPRAGARLRGVLAA